MSIHLEPIYGITQNNKTILMVPENTLLNLINKDLWSVICKYYIPHHRFAIGKYNENYYGYQMINKFDPIVLSTEFKNIIALCDIDTDNEYLFVGPYSIIGLDKENYILIPRVKKYDEILLCTHRNWYKYVKNHIRRARIYSYSLSNIKYCLYVNYIN